MDSERLQTLHEASGERQLQPWVKDLIEGFVSGKEATMEVALDEQAFKDTLAVLQLETFEGSALLGYHFKNTRSLQEADSAEMANFVKPKKEVNVLQFIERLADMHSGGDYPNNFQTSFAIRYDDETAVIIGKTFNEYALHCADCAENMGGVESGEEGLSITAEYSCSHMDGEYGYTSDFRLGLIRLAEFEDRPDWMDPEGIQTLATDERIEAKKGVENGSLELQELEIGDIVRIVGEDKRKGTFVYSFTITNAGNQPTATITELGPEDTLINEEGVSVHIAGTGHWTNWRNNPMVKGTEEQMAINIGYLSKGGFIMVRHAESGELYQLLPTITSVEIIPFDTPEEHAA